LNPSNELSCNFNINHYELCINEINNLNIDDKSLIYKIKFTCNFFDAKHNKLFGRTHITNLLDYIKNEDVF